jgi:hypothetical protein
MCGTVMDVAAVPYMSGHRTTVVISHDEIGLYQLLRGWKGGPLQNHVISRSSIGFGGLTAWYLIVPWN